MATLSRPQARRLVLLLQSLIEGEERVRPIRRGLGEASADELRQLFASLAATTGATDAVTVDALIEFLLAQGVSTTRTQCASVLRQYDHDVKGFWRLDDFLRIAIQPVEVTGGKRPSSFDKWSGGSDAAWLRGGDRRAQRGTPPSTRAVRSSRKSVSSGFARPISLLVRLCEAEAELQRRLEPMRRSLRDEHGVDAAEAFALLAGIGRIGAPDHAAPAWPDQAAWPVAGASNADFTPTPHRPPSTHSSPVPHSVSLARLERSFRELWLPLSDDHLDALAARLHADTNGRVTLDAFVAAVEPGAIAGYVQLMAAAAAGYMERAAATAAMEGEGPVWHLSAPPRAANSLGASPRGVNGSPLGVNWSPRGVKGSGPYARTGTPTSPWFGPAGLVGCSPGWARPPHRGSSGGRSTGGLSTDSLKTGDLSRGRWSTGDRSTDGLSIGGPSTCSLSIGGPNTGGCSGSPLESGFSTRGGGVEELTGYRCGQTHDGRFGPAPLRYSETVGNAPLWYSETSGAQEKEEARYHKGVFTPTERPATPHHATAHQAWPTLPPHASAHAGLHTDGASLHTDGASLPQATGRGAGPGSARAWGSVATLHPVCMPHPLPPPPTPHPHPPWAPPTPPVSVIRHLFEPSNAHQVARPSPLGTSATAQLPVRCLDFGPGDAARRGGEADGRAMDATGGLHDAAPMPRNSGAWRSPPLCQPSQPREAGQWSGEQAQLAAAGGAGEWAWDRETSHKRGMQTLHQLVGAAQQLLDRLVQDGAL